MTASQSCRFKGDTREKPSPVVAALREAGALDSKLRYQPGHDICIEYHKYKAADEKAEEDSVWYKKRAKDLEATNRLWCRDGRAQGGPQQSLQPLKPSLSLPTPLLFSSPHTV